MEMIKEFKYKSKDCFITTLRIYHVKEGLVFEQIKQYDFDDSNKVETILIPKEFIADIY